MSREKEFCCPECGTNTDLENTCCHKLSEMQSKLDAVTRWTNETEHGFAASEIKKLLEDE